MFDQLFDKAKKAAASGRFPARYIDMLQRAAIRAWLEEEGLA